MCNFVYLPYRYHVSRPPPVSVRRASAQSAQMCFSPFSALAKEHLFPFSEPRSMLQRYRNGILIRPNLKPMSTREAQIYRGMKIVFNENGHLIKDLALASCSVSACREATRSCVHTHNIVHFRSSYPILSTISCCHGNICHFKT